MVHDSLKKRTLSQGEKTDPQNREHLNMFADRGNGSNRNAKVESVFLKKEAENIIFGTKLHGVIGNKST